MSLSAITGHRTEPDAKRQCPDAGYPASVNCSWHQDSVTTRATTILTAVLTTPPATRITVQTETPLTFSGLSQRIWGHYKISQITVRRRSEPEANALDITNRCPRTDSHFTITFPNEPRAIGTVKVTLVLTKKDASGTGEATLNLRHEFIVWSNRDIPRLSRAPVIGVHPDPLQLLASKVLQVYRPHTGKLDEWPPPTTPVATKLPLNLANWSIIEGQPFYIDLQDAPPPVQATMTLLLLDESLDKPWETLPPEALTCTPARLAAHEHGNWYCVQFSVEELAKYFQGRQPTASPVARLHWVVIQVGPVVLPALKLRYETIMPRKETL